MAATVFTKRPARRGACRRAGIATAWALVVLLVAAPLGRAAPADPGPRRGSVDGRHHNRLLIGFGATPAAERDLLLARLGVSLETRAGAVDVVTTSVGATPSVRAALESDPRVRYVERDFVVASHAMPNDPFFDQQWWLHNDGEPVFGSPAAADADIDAPEAWDFATGSTLPRVALIDSGVDYAHPELGDAVWVNAPEAQGSPGIDDDGNGFVDDVRGWDWVADDADPSDVGGHGTGAAGIISARGNNAVGVAGTNWTSSLIALRVLDEQGRAFASDVVAAIAYARAGGARIINMSFGSGTNSSALSDAIASAGDVLFVVSSGNAGANIDVNPVYPCAYTHANLVCTAASDPADALAVFSNYGVSSVDVAAPGQAILTTAPGNDYVYRSGTSFAAPVVAGAAALALSKNRDLSVAQMRDAILAGADPRPALEGKVATGARVNLFRTLHHAAPGEVPAEPPPPPSPSASEAPTSPPPTSEAPTPSPTASEPPAPEPTTETPVTPLPSSPSPSPSPTDPSPASPEASDPASASAPGAIAPAARTVELEIPRPKVRYGALVALTGRVISESDECRSGALVSIDRAVVGADPKWEPFGTTSSGPSGEFALTIRADRSAHYVAVVTEQVGCVGAFSDPRTLLVRPRIAIRVSDRRVRPGDAVRVRGRVRPCGDHARGSIVLLTRDRSGRSARQKHVDQRCAADFSIRIRTKTTLRLRWRKQDADHLRATSRMRTVTVTA